MNKLLVFHRLLSIILLVMAIQVANAKTYYISPFGDDNSGSGSKENPWKSLSKATNNITTPGDLIHINPGVYIEIQTCNLAPGVSIIGEGEQSIIKSAVPGVWTALISARSEEGTNGNQSISHIVLDGQQMTGFLAIWITGRSHVSVNNCHIRDFKDRGVVFDGRSDNQPGPPKKYAIGNRFYQNTIENCAAYNTDNGIYGRGCLNIGGQDGMEIHDNLITQLSRPDGFNGWPIKYSSDGYLKACKIYSNVLRKKPFTGTYAGENGWDFAIELWNLEGGVEIYDNKIQGSVDLVICSKKQYPFGIWIRNNTIQQENLSEYFESGLIIEQSANSLIIENNTFNKLSGGINFHAQKETFISEITIRNNTFKNMGRNTGNGNNGSFIYFDMGNLLGPSEGYVLNDVSIENNNFSMNKGNAPLYGLIFSGYSHIKKIQVTKNTFANVHLAWLFANPAKEIDSLIVVSNKYFDNGRNGNVLFIDGRPAHFINSFNEINSNEADKIKFRKRIREQILRPVYYELKTAGVYSFLISIVVFIAFIFMLRNSVIAFPLFLLALGILSYESYGHNLVHNVIMSAILSPCIIYSWVKWNKTNTNITDYTVNVTLHKSRLVMETVRFVVVAALVYLLHIFFVSSQGYLEFALLAVAISSFICAMLPKEKENSGRIYWIIFSAFAYCLFCFYRNSLIGSFYFLAILLCTLLFKIFIANKRVRD